MSNRDIGIRALIPGQRSPNEVREDENTRRYVETVLNQKDTTPEMDPLETFLRASPTINLKATPKEETKEKPMNLDKVLIDQAKGAEMVRKARQDPQWVDSYNKRFGPHFKTTVLPKDKTVAQLQTLKNWGLAKPKTKAMPINTYVDKMNVLYSGQEKRKVDDQGKWINDDKKLKAFVKAEDPTKGAHYIPWQDRMAQEEAEHLNSIKRQTWKNGGSVGPEPKYVSAQDVQNVYDQPKASPVQMKQLHKRLQNHNQRTGEFKNLPKEEDHPYLKGIEEDLQRIDDKGKSWFSKHLKKTKW